VIAKKQKQKKQQARKATSQQQNRNTWIILVAKARWNPKYFEKRNAQARRRSPSNRLLIDMIRAILQPDENSDCKLWLWLPGFWLSRLSTITEPRFLLSNWVIG
jgi:hypothetical protein